MAYLCDEDCFNCIFDDCVVDVVYKNKNVLSEDMKQRRVEYRKRYYQFNKEKIDEYNRIYQEENRAKIAEYKRIYRQKNKDKIAEYNRNYYRKSKDLKVSGDISAQFS